jgi:hypothetical protein
VTAEDRNDARVRKLGNYVRAAVGYGGRASQLRLLVNDHSYARWRPPTTVAEDRNIFGGTVSAGLPSGGRCLRRPRIATGMMPRHRPIPPRSRPPTTAAEDRNDYTVDTEANFL